MGKIRRLIVYTDKIKSSKKVLVYSDLHLGFKKGIDINVIKKHKELDSENYDCILIVGDIVHCINAVQDEETKKNVLAFLEQLTGNTPTFYVLGNHDQIYRRHFEGFESYSSYKLIESLSELRNFNYLRNGQVVNFEGLELKGINNESEYYLRDNESNESFLNDWRKINNNIQFSERTYSILLVHDPKAIYRLKKETGILVEKHTDLVISGHMHNAMVPNFLQNVLKGRGFISPDYTILPSYAYGVRQEGDTLFLINGAINSFMENEILNKLYGFNCTELFIEPKLVSKRLMYTYK